jgi:hypothetical protein
VSVNISAQKQQLKEEHAGDPDRCGSPEPWQEHLGYQRLDLEEQKGTQENSGVIKSFTGQIISRS